MRVLTLGSWAIVLTTICASSVGHCDERLRFDLTDPAAVAEWSPAHDLSAIEAANDGMRLSISGGDPYTVGPPRDLPVGRPLWLRIRLKSSVAGTAQIFYFTTGPTEGSSVRVNVPTGRWVEAKAPLPPLGPGHRLRIDPPGTSGTCTIAWVAIEDRVLLSEPVWPKPPAVTSAQCPLVIRSAATSLRHSSARWGAFTMEVRGRTVAWGNAAQMIGVRSGAHVTCVSLAKGARTRASLRSGSIHVDTVVRSRAGATWRLSQVFRPGDLSGTFRVETRMTSSAPCELVYWSPIAMLSARRERGLLCGLEYLDQRDSSSSEADIVGPGANRRVPDTLRVTIPLMAIQARGHYAAIAWTPGDRVCPLYDTPDRVYRSGGHVMGLLVPGSNGENREEGNLLPYTGLRLTRGAAVSVSAVVMCGAGASVLPAVQQWVRIHGLPRAPSTGMDVGSYARWAAAGWLKSGIREGALYRHAYWPGITSFGPVAAGDVPVWMWWLAGRVSDPALRSELAVAARDALARASHVPNQSGVSHVRYPVTSLVFGGTSAWVEDVRRSARQQVAEFGADGTLRYSPRPGGEDYGRTHWENHANGLGASRVAGVLEAAVLTRDAALLQHGLRLVDSLGRYANSAPRGAQTWECPLHTPDVLASAHMVRAFTLAYEATGQPRYLASAVHWAWTGVPFIYLVAPTRNPVGLYASIAVFGATNWQAPNWMGLPVQWCGLVYSDALYRLSRYDASVPWLTIARGITASGIQQSFPSQPPDLQGLLPDSYSLRTMVRNAVAINPGTVQANAIAYYGGPTLYDYRVCRKAGITVSAPGAITVDRDERTGVSFTVAGWSSEQYDVLLAGLPTGGVVTVAGVAVKPEWSGSVADGRAAAVVRAAGRAKIVVRSQP